MSDTEQRIAPGALAQPGPVAWSLGKTTLDDGTPLNILRFEHATGTTILGLPEDGANALGHALIRQTTGLEIVKSGNFPTT